MSVGDSILDGLRYLRDLWCGPHPNSPQASTDQSDSGAALVEFTILMPVFFLILFGMVEFGSMVWLQNNMTNAAREGARTGAVQGGSPTHAACSWLGGTGQSFSISSTDLCPGSPDIQVQVSIPAAQASLFNMFMQVSNGGLTTSTWSGTITTKVTMRKENACTTTIAAASCTCNGTGVTASGCP